MASLMLPKKKSILYKQRARKKGADINRGVIFACPGRAFFGAAVLAAELNSICPEAVGEGGKKREREREREREKAKVHHARAESSCPSIRLRVVITG